MARYYRLPHVRVVVRSRVMCQAGRARAAGARDAIVAWLCERAPLCTLSRCFIDRDVFMRDALDHIGTVPDEPQPSSIGQPNE